MDFLFNDIYNYIFSYTIKSSSLFVCKKWYELITNNMVKCMTCNKIIKIYDTELYATDNYYLECHGHPLLSNDIYIVASFAVPEKIFLQKLMYLENDSYVLMFVSKNNIYLFSKTANFVSSISLGDIKIDYYTYCNDQIIVPIDPRILYTQIHSLSKQSITVTITCTNTFKPNVLNIHVE